MPTVLVVGGGIAGHEAAWAAKRQQPRAKVVILQDEAHPLYSACVLAEYVSGRLPRERVFLMRPEDYARADIEFYPQSPVLEWDPRRRWLAVPHGDQSYDALVLATGSIPLVPTIPGADLRGVQSLKCMADADSLVSVPPSRAVVVGAGPVGIECALGLRARGWEVHLVELMPRVLPRLLDAPLASMVEAMLEERGIEVLTGERVLALEGRGRVEAVRTESTCIETDRVVLVLGMRPQVGVAREGGVGLGSSGGIQVDAGMNTSMEGVWACGDCVESRDLITGRVGLHMLWGNAVQQGRTAGANAAGGKRVFPGSLNVTTVCIGERAVASIGFIEADLRGQDASLLVRKDAMGNAMGLVLLEGKIVGAQAVGALRRIGGLLRILLQGGQIDDLAAGPAGVRPGGLGGRLWPLRGLERALGEGPFSAG